MAKHTSPLMRIAVMFGAATALWLAVYSTVNAVFGADYSRTTHVVRAVIIFVLAMGMVLVLRKLMEGKANLRGIGVDPIRRAWRPFLAGAAAWVIPAAAALGVCLAAGWTGLSLNADGGAVMLNVLSLVVLVFVYEAFPEEVIFRGYIFHNAALVKSLGVAVGIQAVLFVLWGALNGGEVTLDRSILFLVFGVVVGVMRAITGSVWTTIGYHVAFQVVAQLFGSVGGGQVALTNPGLSLVIFGVVPIAFAVPVLHWFYKKRPDWKSVGGGR